MNSGDILQLRDSITDSTTYFSDLVITNTEVLLLFVTLCVVMGFFTYLLRKLFGLARFNNK